eukprot:gnl/TRDRNA2_/TRDRNA2_127969_c0_seq1.p1 gnl/TRDRNA2_/TRDRNA2_127969_c0~~gnl/TRDRNA2_/TRDRNA2_127969_c0_seq1.p1  ORF type:complete len:351 (-),score=35.45 gnl/TRDRNA2_/TRDRNA2_127969_c0_seq1:196-1152(-)
MGCYPLVNLLHSGRWNVACLCAWAAVLSPQAAFWIRLFSAQPVLLSCIETRIGLRMYRFALHSILGKERFSMLLSSKMHHDVEEKARAKRSQSHPVSDLFWLGGIFSAYIWRFYSQLALVHHGAPAACAVVVLGPKILRALYCWACPNHWIVFQPGPWTLSLAALRGPEVQEECEEEQCAICLCSLSVSSAKLAETPPQMSCRHSSLAVCRRIRSTASISAARWSPFKTGRELSLVTLRCGHKFHMSCARMVGRWAQERGEQPRCPMCRALWHTGPEFPDADQRLIVHIGITGMLLLFGLVHLMARFQISSFPFKLFA